MHLYPHLTPRRLTCIALSRSLIVPPADAGSTKYARNSDRHAALLTAVSAPSAPAPVCPAPLAAGPRLVLVERERPSPDAVSDVLAVCAEALRLAGPMLASSCREGRVGTGAGMSD